MKRFLAVALLVGTGTTIGLGQFKSQMEEENRIRESLFAPTTSSSLFGWFNPDNFHMRHSLSFSYATAGGQSLSLSTYTNTMIYQFADNLNARADISMSYSPYNSPGMGKDNNLSSIYLSNAEINYKPWENMSLHLRYQSVPYGTYRSSYFNPFYRESGF